MKFREKATGRVIHGDCLFDDWIVERDSNITSLDYRSWRERWFEAVMEDKPIHFDFRDGTCPDCRSLTSAHRIVADWSLVTCPDCLKHKPSAPIDDAALVEELKYHVARHGYFIFDAPLDIVLARLREKGWTPPSSRRRSDVWVSKTTDEQCADTDSLRRYYRAARSLWIGFDELEFRNWLSSNYTLRVVEWVDG